MKFSTLVERMVPLVAELFATLKTNDPLRMDFADIGHKTLLDIVTVLRDEGLTNDEIAATLDLSIAGFYKRVKELRETYAPASPRKRRTTLWERAYEVVLGKTGGSPLRGVKYPAIQAALPSVSDERLRSTLRFLVRYGLLTVTGPATLPEYRVIPQGTDPGVTLHAVNVTLYRDGPLTLEALAERLDASGAECLPHVEALRTAGKIIEARSDDGAVTFKASGYHIEPESEEGFQAALWDHFHVVVRAICKKVRMRRHLQATATNGGTTFSFDIPVGSPLYGEVSGFLGEMRTRMEDWLQRVVALDAATPAEVPRARVTIYTGQMVEELAAIEAVDPIGPIGPIGPIETSEGEEA